MMASLIVIIALVCSTQLHTMQIHFIEFIWYVHFSFSETTSNEEFHQWEQDFLRNIQAGENVFDEDRNDIENHLNDEPHKFNLMQSLKILKDIKEFSLNKGYSSLFSNTNNTIFDMETIMCSGNEFIQTQITTYFRRSI